MDKWAEISDLIGKTLTAITVHDNEEIRFQCADGTEYQMYHDQGCCEHVSIDDIDGDIQRLVGQEVIIADERWSCENPPNGYDAGDSFTWTFYTLRTNLDSVTIRWFGTSSGYYSEAVDFVQIVGRE